MPDLKAVAKPKLSNQVSTYTLLLKRVRETLAQGRERAADLVERVKVRTCWETGKLIHEHILLNQDRAEYGTKVIKKLSADISISVAEIQYMVQFAKAYPIYPTSVKLSWSHYRELLSVNERDQRNIMAEQAVKQRWGAHELRRAIQKRRTAKEITLKEFPQSAPLAAKRGTLYTYKIILAKLGPWQGKPVIDLGFSNYFRPQGNFPFKENEMVEVNAKGKIQKTSVKTEEDLFTYKVYVDEVTDGDTIWVLVDLGFGITTKQQLRLRGLDCPEIASRDGQAAKKFVEKSLLSSPNDKQVIITSTKSDKYDRYLADVWIGDTYLNQKLIDKGLAIRVSK